MNRKPRCRYVGGIWWVKFSHAVASSWSLECAYAEALEWEQKEVCPVDNYTGNPWNF